jgi:virginiamycin B lyase
MAIAAAADGTVWFTIDQADAIGRVRGDRIELLPTSGRNYEPLGLAVAADGSAWYTDIKAGAVMRVNRFGEVVQFALDSAIVRLGRVAIAPDGSVWFADAKGAGITQLKDGTFTSHEIGSADSGPYGVAVSSDGIVWATLQAASKLIRIEPSGAMATIDLSRPAVVPTDVAVGPDGSVWFLQFRANRIGRLKNGEFPISRSPSRMQALAGWWSQATEPSGSEWSAVRVLVACATARSQHSAFRVTRPGPTASLSIPTAMFGMPTSADMSACSRPDTLAVPESILRCARRRRARRSSRADRRAQFRG